MIVVRLPSAAEATSMTHTECEYLPSCPIFARFKADSTKNFWIEVYCRGSKQRECARRKLREAGKEVPLTLLPNGTHLPTLAD